MGKRIITLLAEDNKTVRGYQYGSHFLLKRGKNNREFEWIITKEDRVDYSETEFWRLVDAGKIILCESYLQGMKVLKTLR